MWKWKKEKKEKKKKKKRARDEWNKVGKYVRESFAPWQYIYIYTTI